VEIGVVTEDKKWGNVKLWLPAKDADKNSEEYKVKTDIYETFLKNATADMTKEGKDILDSLLSPQKHMVTVVFYEKQVVLKDKTTGKPFIYTFIEYWFSNPIGKFIDMAKLEREKPDKLYRKLTADQTADFNRKLDDWNSKQGTSAPAEAKSDIDDNHDDLPF